MSDAILHLGAGKLSSSIIKHDKKDNTFNVFLDRSYDNTSCENISHIEELFIQWVDNNRHTNLFCNQYIFEFCDAYKFKFTKIIANRIFEHMFYSDGSIGRLLETCNVLTEDNGTLEIIVPNASILAHELIDLGDKLRKSDKVRTVNLSDIQNQILLLNTEFCNNREDPHGSVWTLELAKYYIESEGIFKIDLIKEVFTHMGRSCYMKIVCSKNKKGDNKWQRLKSM
tara:strand:- start:436 stop:1116 length:681 start_codon:yes stop_codon:yes gene_type:complete